MNPFRALQRHRNFRLFWFGQTASLIGTWMHSVATAWLALELSNDAFMVGVVSAANTLPILLLSLPGGVLADRHDRLRIVKVVQSLMLLEAAVLWWFTWTGHLTVPWLAGFALLNGALAAFEIPARQSLMVELVGKDDLLDAIALNSGGFNFARVAGPSIAAAVIAQWGTAAVFAADAASYLFVLVGLSLIRLAPAGPREGAAGSARAGIVEAWRYLRHTRVMWILVRVVAVFSVLAIPVLTLLPVLARDVLRLGAGGYGALMASFGVGAVAGAVLLPVLARRAAKGTMLRRTTLLLPVTILAVAASRWPPVTAVLLVLAGTTMMLNNALVNGLLQELVPDALRGRVLAVYAMVYIGLNPVGAFLAGWIARHVGADVAIGGLAAVLLVAAAYVVRRYDELRRL